MKGQTECSERCQQFIQSPIYVLVPHPFPMAQMALLSVVLDAMLPVKRYDHQEEKVLYMSTGLLIAHEKPLRFTVGKAMLNVERNRMESVSFCYFYDSVGLKLQMYKERRLKCVISAIARFFTFQPSLNTVCVVVVFSQCKYGLSKISVTVQEMDELPLI